MYYLDMDERMLTVIAEILARGNTAEVKKRKDDIIILEVERKIWKSIPTNG